MNSISETFAMTTVFVKVLAPYEVQCILPSKEDVSSYPHHGT